MAIDDNSKFDSGYDSASTANSANASLVAIRKPIRLAILAADTPQPMANAKYGGYLGVFVSLLTKATKSMSESVDDAFQFSAHDVVNDLGSYPDLDEIDAILITGSKHNAYDNDAWILKLVEYTKQAINAGVKTVGVCFGHQIIGRAMGAQVGTSDKGWEISVRSFELTSKGKEIFQLPSIRIQQMHRDIVQTFPKGAIPLGGNAKCAVQSMYAPGQYLTVQGHPEFTEEIIGEIMFKRHAAGVFTDDMYKEAKQLSVGPHDGVAIGRAFVRFFREG